MELYEIFERFSLKMTDLVQLQLSMRRIANQELQELNARKKMEGIPTDGLPISLSNMLYRSAIDGNHLFFGRKRLFVDDLIRGVFVHKNKQYQWLLAEAYEAYEDYIEEVYAWAGLRDKGLWPIADYGNLTLEKLEGLSYQQSYELARKKKNKPHSILAALRARYPSLEELEKSNALNVHLRFVIVFIEKLRHVIVHNGGVVESLENFTDKVVKESAIVKREEQVKAKNEIDIYFRKLEGRMVVHLLELPAVEGELHSLGMYHDMCGDLFSLLVTHADLLARCCDPSFGT